MSNSSYITTIIGYSLFALSEFLPLLPIPANGFLHSIAIGLQNSFSNKPVSTDLEIAQNLLISRPNMQNIISTLGNGGKNPVPSKEVDYYIIIDKNIIFGEEHLDLLSKTDNPFVCGWKSTTNSENGNRVVVAGKWDEEFYNEHGSMPVLRYEDLVKVQESDPERLIEVDYSEFGFVRIHRSIFEKMQYPFFRLNVQDFNGTPDLLSDDISFCLNCTKETGIKPHLLSGLHVNSISFVKLP